jgi:hypothetical protein
MKTQTVHVIFFALAGFVLLAACSPVQRDVYLDSRYSSPYTVCPTELDKLAKNVQDVEQAKAAIRGYLICRKMARVAEPSMQVDVRDALTRNPWPAVMRASDTIETYFFDRDLIYKAPSHGKLSTWVQMLRDRKLLAEATGDSQRAEALEARITKGEFAETVMEAGH